MEGFVKQKCVVLPNSHIMLFQKPITTHPIDLAAMSLEVFRVKPDPFKVVSRTLEMIAVPIL
jgi:hypothetical protein